MTVLFISFSELPTLQRHMYVLSSEIAKLGVDVYTIGSKNVVIDVDLGAKNKLVDTPPSPKPCLASLSEMTSGIKEIAAIAEGIQPDIVHFTNKHTWNYFLLRKLRKALPRTKFLHTFHDPVGHEGDSVQKGVVLYHRITQNLLDGVVVHSEIAQKQVEDILKPKCPVFQVPLGEKPWRGYEPVVDGCKEALIFGRLNPYKGLCYYPAILDELYKLDPSIHVTIAGKSADRVDGNLLLEIGSKPNCDLKNEFIDDSEIDGYFHRASVVLIPYTSITQSGVILDAYSRSRSVIAFDIPGMSQYVPDPRSRIRPFDCESFAKVVAERLGDQLLLAASNEMAWSYGRSHFSPEMMADAMFGLYRDLLK